MKNSDKFLIIAGIVLISFNLRTPITAVGSVIDLIQAEYGLSAGVAGGITTLPLLMFAAVSPFIPKVSAKLGYGKTMALGLVFIALGEIVRSYTGLIGLFIGTAMIGAGIAVGNVLIPGIIKRNFPGKAGTMTGVYTSGMCIFAAVGAGTSVPMASGLGWGWANALVFWLVLAIVTFIVWLPQLKVEPDAVSASAQGKTSSIWKDKVAWYVTIFMGIQSLVFYTLVAWLPSIVMSKIPDANFAGTVAFIYQIVSIPATFALPIMCDRCMNQRGLAMSVAIVYIIGLVGLLFATSEIGIVASVVLMALGMGGAISLAIAFISLRSPNAMRTSELSGMSQSAGYLLAAVGPMLIGSIFDVTGSWTIPMWIFIICMAAWAVTGLFAGDDVKTAEN